MAKKGKSKKRSAWRTFFKWSVFVVFSLALFISAWARGTWERVYSETLGVQELMKYRPAQTSVIYDRTGTHKLYELHGAENRKALTHEEIPDLVRDATLATEDSNFYHHHGFDLKAIGRAAWKNFRSSDYGQGASTITQQLARNVFLTQEQTLERKLKELVIAVKIERELSKDEILDLYLNQIPYGADIYGIEAAAQSFFHKSAQDLTMEEAATLAALPKATTYYSPYGSNKRKLIERRNYILDRMLLLGWAGQGEVEIAKSKPIEVFALQAPIEAPHFVFYVFDQLKELYGEDFVRQGGLQIYTSLDYDLQKKAEQIVAEGVRGNQVNYQAENASMVVLNPKNGQVLAMVGSKDYFAKDIDGEVNVALQLRQPGSSFKPIVYAKAFEKGFQPETSLYDARTNFGPDGSGKDYIPNNYDGRFRGPVSMRQALAMSLNIPAVKTLYLAGIKDSIELAERLGISTLTRKNIYGLSLVLGGGEVNLLELTGAFAVFANDGQRAPIKPIVKIIDQKEQVIFEAGDLTDSVLDSNVARKVNSVLSDNNARQPVFGSNSALFIPDYQVAAKTGTTQEYRDAWTIGYTPEVAVGVWAGNNDNRPMRAGAAGIFVAAPIWNKMMKEILSSTGQRAQFVNYQKNEPVGDLTKRGDLDEVVMDWDRQFSSEEIEQMFSLGDEASADHQVNKVSVEFSKAYQNDSMVKRWQKGIKSKQENKKKDKDRGGKNKNK